MTALTVGSLFSGIGGLELGLERAGMQVRWQVECDEYALKVLSKHWPEVPKYRDVRTVSADELGAVDVLCGGFPCQDISQAGLRAGLAGGRSGLWAEFRRLIRELRPRYVIVENVAALLIRGAESVFGDLAELGMDAEWSVIPACALGAPHMRHRLFIVANTKGNDGAERLGHLQDRAPANECGNGGESLRQWWMEPFTGVRGVASGIPSRMDRLRCLGNAVVPQVAELIGRRILAAEAP